MKIVHINTYLCSTSLYYNLFFALGGLSVSQDVIIPLKVNSRWVWDPYCEMYNVRYNAQRYQTKFDRLFYMRKIRKGVRVFGPSFGDVVKGRGVIHAHTLFSDGGLAYEFSRRSGLPYVVAVRSTDINVFWKYMPHMRRFGRKILKNASAIIFLSEAYRHSMEALLPIDLWEDLKDKCKIIPNGISLHWFQEPCIRDSFKAVHLLYIGRFDKNKNLNGTIKAASLLRSQGVLVKLRLVGAQGAYANAIRKKYNCEWIDFFNYTNDVQELKKHFAWANVFAMPSFNESFGLVYAEALSQGVPVIYSKGQGFDGWCTEPTCGLGVNPYDVKEIASSVLKLVNAQNPTACKQLAEKFRWERISITYRQLYLDIVNFR